uniref:Cytochrome P450 n=1 Tax=Rhabditophanes sp. KR3021 TaxID=114890 RepID=A0AC35TYM8_9BILA
MDLWFEEQRKIYGDVFTIFIPTPFVVISGTKTLKEALVTNADDFIGRKLAFPDTLFHEELNVGVIFSDGASWRDQRRLSLRILRDIGLNTEEKIMLSVEELFEHADSLQNKDNVDISKLLHLCIGNVINSIVFGFRYKHDDAEDFHEFQRYVDKVMKQGQEWQFRMLAMFPELEKISIFKRLLFRPFSKNNRILKEMNLIKVKQLEKTFDPDAEPTNFTHALLKEIRNPDSRNSYMSDAHIHGMIFDFYFAGQETSTSVSRWIILFLTKYMDIQHKLQKEIDENVGRDNRLKMSDKPHLPYLNAFIYESLRVGNIVPFIPAHVCTRDVVIAGQLIPKGACTQPNFGGTTQDEEIFGDPKVFRPERFLLEDGVSLRMDLVDQMDPFGQGKRICAGKSLAMQELFLITGSLVQRYEFTHDHAPIDLTRVFAGVIPPPAYTCKMVRRV